MTSKEALNELYYCIEFECDIIDSLRKQIYQELDRLEKLEKVIEILKGKTIIIFALKLSKDLSDYNRMTDFDNLTQEEYEILKEWL